MILRSLLLLAWLISGTAFGAGPELLHCEREPAQAEPCTPADSYPLISLDEVMAIGFTGDTIRRQEKRLYHILSGEQVGRSVTIEFKLFDISGDSPVYKDQSVLNPENNWYSCWVSFTYVIPGKYRMVAVADGLPLAEDTFEVIMP